MKKMTLNLPMIAALAAVLSVSPSLAQKGNGNGHDKHDRQRTEAARRDRDRNDDRYENRDDDDRRRRNDSEFRRRQARRVPPGWCRGVGNPHRTAANCGTHTDGIYRDRNGVWRDRNGHVLNRDGVYRDRNGVIRDRNGRVLRSGTTTRTPTRSTSTRTYAQQHEDFHRRLRESCNSRAEGRSIADRTRILRECSAQHDAWHRQMGRAH